MDIQRYEIDNIFAAATKTYLRKRSHTMFLTNVFPLLNKAELIIISSFKRIWLFILSQLFPPIFGVPCGSAISHKEKGFLFTMSPQPIR